MKLMFKLPSYPYSASKCVIEVFNLGCKNEVSGCNFHFVFFMPLGSKLN